VPPLLQVEGLTTGYGRVRVLDGVTLTVPEGATVAVLGPNGVGKTTLLRAIAGTLPPWDGTISLSDRRIDGRSAYQIARAGVTLIPEGRGVFPGLTVDENLAVAARAARDASPAERASRLEKVLAAFPVLAERGKQRASTLSGGEQQMLALSRAFLAEPRLLMMDELSMGLAPKIVEELFGRVQELRQQGQSMLIVEQYLTYALRVADICYVMSKGRITFVGEPAELEQEDLLAFSA
jgi:branched-chain amino acid transport system ATP-binding protein